MFLGVWTPCTESRQPNTRPFLAVLGPPIQSCNHRWRRLDTIVLLAAVCVSFHSGGRRLTNWPPPFGAIAIAPHLLSPSRSPFRGIHVLTFLRGLEKSLQVSAALIFAHPLLPQQGHMPKCCRQQNKTRALLFPTIIIRPRGRLALLLVTVFTHRRPRPPPSDRHMVASPLLPSQVVEMTTMIKK